MSTTETNGDRAVIVCTKHRGVFFGYARRDAQSTDPSIKLRRARMAVVWGTTRGVMELAETGPTGRSKLSARADIDVADLTAIFEVTPASAERWEAAP